MLVNYSFKNFRSFKDASTLEMIPANVRDIPYSILKAKVGQEYKALCSAIIYGANASGKSNVILSLAFFKELIISGNLKNQRCIPIDLVPCFFNKKNEPIDFSIKFIYQNFVFDYAIQIGNAIFLSENNNPIIERETLSINEKRYLKDKENK